MKRVHPKSDSGHYDLGLTSSAFRHDCLPPPVNTVLINPFPNDKF